LVARPSFLSASHRKARTEISPVCGQLNSAERRDFFHGDAKLGGKVPSDVAIEAQ
jgi:hypothetical protein